MTPDAIHQAAAAMIAIRDKGGPVPRLDPAIRPATDAEGYAVQDEIVRQRDAAGQPLAGWKIGCTTKEMQEMLGLDSPSGGAVFAANVHASSARFEAAALTNPVAECEIGVRLASYVPARDGGHDRDSIAGHVATCFAAIELAELRLPQREEMAVAEMIADDFFQKAVVMGPETADWRDLDFPALRGTTAVNGETRGEGLGGDVMGHPLTALAWLADALAARGTSLKAGQIVLTGSMVRAAPIASGETAICAIEGLGEASLTLA